MITGASSGIGLHLAREFASQGHPVVLVAPVESELRAIADELNGQFGVRTRAIARNLEAPEAAQEIFDTLASDGIDIDILVNNGGHGFKGHFWTYQSNRICPCCV